MAWLSVLLLAVMLVFTLSGPCAAQQDLSPLARSIQNDVDLLDSRVTTRNNRVESTPLPQRTRRERGRLAEGFTVAPLRSAQGIALGSDLSAAQQDLRTLKTREPNASSTPILERQLDRVSRQAGGTQLFNPSRRTGALGR